MYMALWITNIIIHYDDSMKRDEDWNREFIDLLIALRLEQMIVNNRVNRTSAERLLHFSNQIKRRFYFSVLKRCDLKWSFQKSSFAMNFNSSPAIRFNFISPTNNKTNYITIILYLFSMSSTNLHTHILRHLCSLNW